MRERWEHQVPGVPLVIVESPYRALVGPLIAYLDVLDRAWPPDKAAPITFVVVPEYVARQLVGADPLQPVGPAAADRPPRPAAHGRRQRPVPARGCGDARAARRRRPRSARPAAPAPTRVGARPTRPERRRHAARLTTRLSRARCT